MKEIKMQNAALQMSDEDNAEIKKAGGAFRTISEVADELGVQQHVLRFWETKFNQIRPMKRGGGRRYYRPEDVALLKHIHTLLYSEGYTIKGAQKLLKGQSKGSIAAAHTATEVAEKARQTASNATPITAATTRPQAQANDLQPVMIEALQGMLSDLKELRALVAKAS
jgi:DNA-binding transcriptional MerR regulator